MSGFEIFEVTALALASAGLSIAGLLALGSAMARRRGVVAADDGGGVVAAAPEPSGDVVVDLRAPTPPGARRVLRLSLSGPSTGTQRAVGRTHRMSDSG